MVDMDSQAKISDTQSDSASDISTEIILGTTQSSLDKKQTVLHVTNYYFWLFLLPLGQQPEHAGFISRG